MVFLLNLLANVSLHIGQRTVMCFAADNLAAHGLAGFVRCFRGQFVCRFCSCTTDQIQSTEVSEGEFSMRTRACHDLHVQNVVQGETHLILVLRVSALSVSHCSIFILFLVSRLIYFMTFLNVLCQLSPPLGGK